MPLTTLTSGASAQGFGAGLRRRYTAEVLADSPLAFWLLADTSGTTVTDSSGNSRTLTYVNSPTLNQTGPSANITKAVSFDGTNDIAYGAELAAFNLSPAGNWTMEAWVKTSTAGTGTICRLSNLANTSGGRLADLTCSGSGSLQVYCNDAAGSGFIYVTATGTYYDGKWHHVVATGVSGGAMTIYVDGVSRASSTASRNNNTASKAGQIGATYNNGPIAAPLNAQIAAVAMYNSTLSQARITSHYLAGV